MTFRRDLETWTADQVALRGLSGLSSDIRRLLRGADVGGLSPVDSSGLPSEILEAFPPSRDVPTEPPPESSTWICWPSADNAPYGWGDPYGPNPPLGTIQPSFSDTAHIAREIDPSDIVTHGVNKIAAPRDWRDSTSALVVSWDSGSIYSGGSEIVAGTGIMAACVRWSGGVPYLLWLIENPDVIYSAECTIVDDVVTEVIGSVSSVTVSGGMTDAWWCEFSQDGNSAVINKGASTSDNSAYSIAIPAVLSGQSVPLVFEKGSSPSDITWINWREYSGTKDSLVKSQYVNNVLVHAEITVLIEKPGEFTDSRNEYPSAHSDGDVYQVCASEVPDFYGNVACYIAPIPGGPPMYTQTVSRDDSYAINCEITIDSVTRFSTQPYNFVGQYASHSVNGGVSTRADPTSGIVEPRFVGILPAPPGTASFWTDWCGQLSGDDVSNPGTIVNHVTGRDIIDVRYDRISSLFTGGSDDGGFTYTTTFESRIYRGGSLTDSASIDGDYGTFSWPDENVIRTSASLDIYLSSVTNTVCDPKAADMWTGHGDGGVVALDLSTTRTVQCAWGQELAMGPPDYVDLLEGADIDTMLSIENQDNQRIIIRSADRFFGLLKQS